MLLPGTLRVLKPGFVLTYLKKMIESCTKKRMALGILVLVILSVMVLVIESSIYIHTTGNNKEVISPHSKKKDSNITKAIECWLKEKAKILNEKCHECTKFEKAHEAACKMTGYKVPVICEKTGKVFKSCQKPRDKKAEELHFWIFEIVTLIVGLLSYCVVRIRQRKLDKILMERINRQISAGA